MKYFISVCLVKTRYSAKLNINSCKFEGVYLFKISAEAKGGIPIILEFADVFQETLPGLPFKRKIGHKLKSLVQISSKSNPQIISS